MPPDPTCPECDAELIDIDMAEDPDDPTVRWNTGRCPDPDCVANTITNQKATKSS